MHHSRRYAFKGGENLLEGTGYSSPRSIVNTWLKSPEHRRNLLSPRARKAGVGISKSKGKMFVAWAFSDEPPTYPDCPYYKPHRRKIVKVKTRGVRSMRFLWILLAIIFAIVFLISVVSLAIRPSAVLGIVTLLSLTAAIYFGQKK
jgi:hypothetical protein